MPRSTRARPTRGDEPVGAAAAPSHARDDGPGNAFLAEQARLHGGGEGHEAADQATALAEHREHQLLVGGVIERALRLPAPEPTDKLRISRELLLRNAAQWVEGGEVEVQVLSSTHDALDRKPGEMAVFDHRIAWPDAGGAYDARSEDGITYVKPGTRGALEVGGGTLRFVNPTARDQVEATLVHEVQHDADQSWSGQVWAEAPPDEALQGLDAEEKAKMSGRWNDYQSEFRAFWIMGDDGSGKTRFGSSKQRAKNQAFHYWNARLPPDRDFHTPAFQNQRQEDIFRYMLDNGYDWVGYYYTSSAAFKEMVDGFTLPEGGNLLDSIRIQHVSEALAGCAPSMGRNDPAVLAALHAADALDPADRAFLASRSLSEPFWDQARASLGADALAAFEERVARPRSTSPDAAPSGDNPDRPVARVSPRAPVPS